MPLYRCADCGFVTTASLVTAVRAHQAGSPQCTGQLELAADFGRTPAIGSKGTKRGRAAGGRGAPRGGRAGR